MDILFIDSCGLRSKNIWISNNQKCHEFYVNRRQCIQAICNSKFIEFKISFIRMHKFLFTSLYAIVSVVEGWCIRYRYASATISLWNLFRMNSCKMNTFGTRYGYLGLIVLHHWNTGRCRTSMSICNSWRIKLKPCLMFLFWFSKTNNLI